MTDTPLLRLARLMLRFVGNESSNDPDSLNLHAALFDLVRDLEAAPPPETERPPSPVETALREFAGFISGDIPELHSVEVPRIAESVSRYLNAAGPHVPPAPARRTITRAQHIHAMQAAQRARQFTLVGGDADDDACRTYAVTLGLTVEDA